MKGSGRVTYICNETRILYPIFYWIHFDALWVEPLAINEHVGSDHFLELSISQYHPLTYLLASAREYH
jgi:hypothetical protein